MARLDELVVIPAFNEEKNLPQTILAIRQAISIKILVYDDGSIDRTSQIARGLADHVIRSQENKGYDETLGAAYEHALNLGYKKILFFDADGEHPAQKIPEFFQALKEYPVVVGIRNRRNRLVESVAAIYTVIRFGISDPYCGMKGYNVEKISSIHEKFHPGSGIGTYLLLNVVKFYGVQSVCQLRINVGMRSDASRYSLSFGKKHLLLLTNILGFSRA